MWGTFIKKSFCASTTVPSAPPLFKRAGAHRRKTTYARRNYQSAQRCAFFRRVWRVSRNVVEALRQPLESGTITVARAQGSVSYPAQFLMIASTNPCPCGFYEDPEKQCKCSVNSIARYRRKLSGPIADRIDIHIQMGRQSFSVIAEQTTTSESSSSIRARIEKAQAVQHARFENDSIYTNAEMGISLLNKHCSVDNTTKQMLKRAMEKYNMSTRAYHNILKVARTVADLEASKKILWSHIATAVGYAHRGD